MLRRDICFCLRMLQVKCLRHRSAALRSLTCPPAGHTGASHELMLLHLHCFHLP